MTRPLLIGGATTSKVHTALRIDPAYQGPVLHVLDASRAVGVATSLVSDTGRDTYVQGYKDDYAHIRDVRAGTGQSVLHTLERSEEHTSELQSLMRNSYAVFCWKKKTKKTEYQT